KRITPSGPSWDAADLPRGPVLHVPGVGVLVVRDLGVGVVRAAPEEGARGSGAMARLAQTASRLGGAPREPRAPWGWGPRASMVISSSAPRGRPPTRKSYHGDLRPRRLSRGGEKEHAR